MREKKDSEENERGSYKITLQLVFFGAVNHIGESKNKIKHNRADKPAKTEKGASGPQG